MNDLSTSLGSGSNGLTAARAAEQLAVVGPNSVEDAQRLGPLRLLWRQVESPLVLILIFAAAVSLGLSQWIDAAIYDPRGAKPEPRSLAVAAARCHRGRCRRSMPRSGSW